MVQREEGCNTQEGMWWCKVWNPKKVVVIVTIAQGVAQTTDDIENYAQYDGYDVRYTQKTSAKQVKSLALFMVDKVKGHILEQQLVMEKFFLSSIGQRFFTSLPWGQCTLHLKFLTHCDVD